MRNNIITAPLAVTSCPDFPVIQYADDTILVLPAEDVQLLQIKNLIFHYAAQIGLKVNCNKSMIILCIVAPGKIANIINILDCQLGSFSFTYLGLPLRIVCQPKIMED